MTEKDFKEEIASRLEDIASDLVYYDGYISNRDLYNNPDNVISLELLFNTIRHFNPANFGAIWGLSMILYEKGEDKKAISLLKESLDNNPNHEYYCDALNLLVEIYSRSGDYENAAITCIDTAKFISLNKEVQVLDVNELAKMVTHSLLKREANEIVNRVSNRAIEINEVIKEMEDYFKDRDYKKVIEIYENKF
jgi:hypothetical protein